MIALVLLLSAQALAAPKPILKPLPKDKIPGMAALLKDSDVALIESDAKGRLAQISILTWVGAPAKLVHDVVADLGKYNEVLANMSESKVSKNADGTADLYFVIRYTLVSFKGTTRHTFREDGAIDLESTDPEDGARFRWEFIPLDEGTVLIMYGWTDVFHSPDVIQSMVKKVRTLEHGFVRLVDEAGMALAG